MCENLYLCVQNEVGESFCCVVGKIFRINSAQAALATGASSAIK